MKYVFAEPFNKNVYVVYVVLFFISRKTEYENKTYETRAKKFINISKWYFWRIYIYSSTAVVVCVVVMDTNSKRNNKLFTYIYLFFFAKKIIYSHTVEFVLLLLHVIVYFGNN